MTIFLVRHPETEYNKKNMVQGHKDSPLTGKGRKLAKELGKKLSGKGIKKIYSSDLGRCMETSQLINKTLNIKIIPKKEIRERNFGEYNGIKNSILRKKLNLKDATKIAPKGESFNQMGSRTWKFLEAIKTKDSILIVTHEGPTRSIISKVKSKIFTNKACNSNPKNILILSNDKKEISKLL